MLPIRAELESAVVRALQRKCGDLKCLVNLVKLLYKYFYYENICNFIFCMYVFRSAIRVATIGAVKRYQCPGHIRRCGDFK